MWLLHVTSFLLQNDNASRPQPASLIPTGFPLPAGAASGSRAAAYLAWQRGLTGSQPMLDRKAAASDAAACDWVRPVSRTANAMLPRYPTNQLSQALAPVWTAPAWP